MVEDRDHDFSDSALQVGMHFTTFTALQSLPLLPTRGQKPAGAAPKQRAKRVPVQFRLGQQFLKDLFCTSNQLELFLKIAVAKSLDASLKLSLKNH